MNAPPNIKLLSPKEGKQSHNAAFPGAEAFMPVKRMSQDFGVLAEPKMTRNVECYRVQVDKEAETAFLETSSWRMKTSLPIVRTFYTNVQSGTFVHIQVFNEHCPHRLQEFSDIPIGMAFYLMKEALYGFERLWQKFGEFEPDAAMIAINENQKCRVWINRNFALNTREKPSFTEEEFIEKVFGIFESRIVKTETSKMFFRQATFCEGFLNALKLINAVIVHEKIKLPSRFDTTFFENREKLASSLERSEALKNQGNQKFFKSANYAKEILHKKSQNNLMYKHNSNSVYLPTKRSRKNSSNMPEKEMGSMGTTLSQTLIPNSSLQFAISYAATARAAESYGFPQTLSTNIGPKRGNRGLFRSSSIDDVNQNCLPEEVLAPETEFIIKDLPNILKGQLAESQVLTSEQFDRFDQKLTQKTPIGKRSAMQEEYDSMDIQPILLKNGWEKKMENLLGLDTPVKQSRIEGKQVRADLHYIRLMKLDAMGTNIVASILPDDLDM